MKKLILILVLSTTIFSARADEGMWLLQFLEKLNIKTMNEMGCKLTAEDIYSLDTASIKDAVVIFGGGCTGEIVSPNGLIFTNHHCGYDDIQSLSSVEHNYLEDGYWAKSYAEELPVPGLEVRFLNAFIDVTEDVLKDITSDLPISSRKSIIEQNSQKIIEGYPKDEFKERTVETFFAGNKYYLVEYTVYRDVRFVGAPPSSIGKFGHDTDNWVWPRHTGDFSIFRVYTNKDGQPAEYSEANIPMKSKKYLPISLKGYKEGDFAMTIGFPGSTDRYLTSWGIDNRMNIENESMIGPRAVKQQIWLADMQDSEEVNIKYASKYASSSNYYKNSIGMNQGIRNLNVLERKRELEDQLAMWINEDTNRKEKYGNVLDGLKEAYEKIKEDKFVSSNIMECLWSGCEIFQLANQGRWVAHGLEEKLPEDEMKALLDERKAIGREFYKNYNASTDKKTVAALINYYAKITEGKYARPNFYTTIREKYKNNTQKYVDDLFKKSVFADSTKYMAFLNNPTEKVLEKDMAYIAVNDILSVFWKILETEEKYQERIDFYNGKFIAALMEMQPNKLFYPDANFTMRLSYGTIGGYKARDAVYYDYFTTLEGVMQKEDSTNWEFVVSPELKDLYYNGDFCRYADQKDEKMHVCFTSNNDITGGNSGSPVIDGEGRLIGLAFDGNWEAMSGDIIFEPEVQKTICVDIRYVLFIIDKLGGAKNIIDELTIVE